MKESSWGECLEKNTSRSITPDYSRAKSLRETALARIEQTPAPSEKNCNFVFEDYYTSILELLQALAFANGFMVLNHVCIGYYLRDKLAREELFVLFDDLRYKRNSLTYYGTQMDFATASKAIKDSKNLYKELEKI